MQKKSIAFVVCSCLLCLSSCQFGTKEEVVVNPEQAAINTQMEIGDQYFEQEDYKQAEHAYTAVLLLDQTYVDAYISRAYTYIQVQELEKAAIDITTGSQILGNDIPASFHEVKAAYHIEKRQYVEAMQAIESALTLEPTNRRIGMQGNLQYRLHEHTKAKQQLLRALQDETDSERAMYLYILTELAIYEGDYPQAISYLDQLQAMDATQSKYHAMQGYVYSKQLQATNSYEEQEKLHTQRAAQVELAWQKDPAMEDAITNNYLGLHYYLLHDTTAALKHYDAAIALEPTYAVFYNNRALVYYADGDNEAAHKDLTKAITLDKLEPEFYLGRAFVSMTLQQEDAAIGDFSQAVKLNPNYLARVPEELRAKLPQKEETKEQQ